MPSISVGMIRLAFMYLGAGVLIGGLMLTEKALHIFPWVWMLLPVHIEFLIFGWIFQFSLGMAYWILPRYLKTKGRGKTLPAIMMAISLNVGVVLVIISALNPKYSFLGLIGRSLQLLAVVLFIRLNWQRIVSYLKFKENPSM